MASEPGLSAKSCFVTGPHHPSTDFAEHLAYFSCSSNAEDGWLPYSQLRLPVDDLGFRQGVTAVERMRTYAGEVFRRKDHLLRFENTMRHARISGMPESATLDSLIDESLRRNSALLVSRSDVGVTLWATPGKRHGGRPTFALHLNEIDGAAVQRRRTQGQAVVLTSVVQPGEESWSRHAKVRCRMHYYLADCHAESIVPGATGVLRDADGSWTESSIANIALLFGRDVAFAPASRVLPGVTQALVKEVCRELSLSTRESPLTSAMITDADALLLMGTDTGLWFARSVHDAQGELLRAAPGESAKAVIADMQCQFICL